MAMRGFAIACLSFISLASAAAIGPRIDAATPAVEMAARSFPAGGEPAQENLISARATKQSNERDEYCGETNPRLLFDASQPLASDCSQIAAAAASTSAFYKLEPSDFNTADGWFRLYSQGTCTFAVRPPPNAKGKALRIGTHDIHFIVEVYSKDAQNGRIGAYGGSNCWNGNEVIGLDWGIIRS